MLSFYVNKFGLVYVNADRPNCRCLGKVNSARTTRVIQAHPQAMVDGHVNLFSEQPIPSAVYGS